MNRATKRLLAKQEKQAERERARSMPLSGGGAGGGSGAARTAGAGGFGVAKKRTQAVSGAPRDRLFKRWTRFFREVRAELKKVAWPSRSEVFTYTVVVLFSVTFVTLLVFVLDFGFGRAILSWFK